MKKIAQIFFNTYLFWIVLCLVPLSILILPFRWFQRRPKSYFHACRFTQPLVYAKNGFRSYRLFSYLISLSLKPAARLGQAFEKKLFQPSLKKLPSTPNQVSALVLSQLVTHLRGVAKVAEEMRANYLFALQPSLMFTGPATPEDKLFYDARNKTKLWGFSWGDFVKVYYSDVIRTLSNDRQLKNHFLNLADIFKDTQEQKFVDTMHMGNLGQAECAKALAEAIWKRSRGGSNA